MISSAGWKIRRTRPGISSASEAIARPLAEEGGGVQVVAAGVRDALDGADPRIGDAVLNRERVEVGAKSDHRPGAGADVHDEPVARQGAGHEPGLVEALGDHRRRALLGPRQLGVGVQVTPQLDQLGGEQPDLGPGTLDEPVDEGGGHKGQGYRSPREPEMPSGASPFSCPFSAGPLS